jgi:hypothetical protein
MFHRRLKPGRLKLVLGAIAMSLAAGTACAQTPDPAAPKVDYAKPELWLCRPDLATNICKANLDATVIPGDGRIFVETYKAAEQPGVDCFFLYPTVSMDPGYVSDFTPDIMEFDDIKQQFARFGQVCRPFAPLYRQITVTALRAASGGPKPVGEMPPAGVGLYADVVEAWRHYLKHENNGRGFILIGHSQGSMMLTRLLAEEIEGRPEQKQLVSAIIIGAHVMVPDGRDTGGSFKSVAACRSAQQTGCVIGYATYRDRNPPPPEGRFGKTRNGMRVLCTNPAALAGGAGALDSYFLTRGLLNAAGVANPPDWLTPHQDIATTFVRTPGLLNAECVRRGDFDYLEISVNAVPEDPRTDDIDGRVVRASGPDHTWGLHMIDVDVAMGDLVGIARQQSAAYLKAGK